MFRACLLPMAWASAFVAVSPLAAAPTAAHEAGASSPAADHGLPLAHPQTERFVDGQLKAWYAPAAQRFATSADALAERTQAWCSSPAGKAAGPELVAARGAWVQAMLSWTRLSTVPIGPLLDRHSETRLDFQPMRPQALDKVIASPTAPGEWAMDRVGAQARGLPAMEYMLWKKPALPRSPACAYLAVLARDLRDEARGLATAYAAEAAATRSPEQAAAWLNTYVNQWMSGVSRLRWKDIEMPVRSWGMDQAPRATSGQTAAAWKERWQALRVPTVGGPGTPEGLLPLAAYLRARGLDAPAQALGRAADAADAAMKDAGPTTPGPKLLDAATQIDRVTHVVKRDVTQLMQIQLEFSADDGD
ncbi:MAG: imelysin family protein [Pseudomonadota bacterium]